MAACVVRKSTLANLLTGLSSILFLQLIFYSELLHDHFTEQVAVLFERLDDGNDVVARDVKRV